MSDEMDDIPLGKALVPVEVDDRGSCDGCFFNNSDIGCWGICKGGKRKDGKSVVFKIIDLPKEADNE